MKELSAVRENVTQYLQTELEAQNIDTVQYKTIQHNLIALLCMRTLARAGTIIKMRASYLQEIEVDEANGLYRIALMPPEIKDIRTGKGQNVRINLIHRQVLESHKNFRNDGEKYLKIKRTDFEILKKYMNLRSLFHLDSSDWLFAPLDSGVTETTKEVVEARMKSYSRTVRKQHNLPNFDANRIRKAVNSHWAETVDDPRAIRALDQQMGHSRAVAVQHYEVAQNKKRNSAFMTTLLDRDLTDVVHKKPREQLALQISGKTDDADEASEGEVTDASEYSPSSDSSSKDQKTIELPSEKEISLFIKRRKQRATQKYQLDDEGRNYLAQVFLKNLLQDNFNLSRAITRSEVPGFNLKLDQVRVIFKQVKDWIREESGQLWTKTLVLCKSCRRNYVTWKQKSYTRSLKTLVP